MTMTITMTTNICKGKKEMNNNMEIMKLLQIAGGNFPIGGFSQSYGLETYIATGKIKSTGQLKELLETYINNTLCRNELPLLIAAYRACRSGDYGTVRSLNELALAVKVTKESREALNKSGKAMLRVGIKLIDDEDIRIFYEKEKNTGIAFNVAFPAIAQKLAIGPENTVSAYMFNSINGLVQAAIKLMPLGNIEGQQLLASLMPTMDDVCRKAQEIPLDQISNFTPAIDMASIDHENLPTRLYMS